MSTTPLAFDSTELRRIADTLDELAGAQPDLGEPHLELGGTTIRIAFELERATVDVPLLTFPRRCPSCTDNTEETQS